MNSLPAAILLGLIATFSASEVAAAMPEDDVQVAFGSHQLATPAGRGAVVASIVETARRACIEPGFRPDTTTASCTREVAAAMIVQIGDPEIAMLWRQDRSLARGAANVPNSRLFAAK